MDLISRKAAIDLLLEKGMITAAIYVERMPATEKTGEWWTNMDLIDRKQLLSIFHNKAFDKANTDIPYRELLWAINVIKQAPSAEKTGEWIKLAENFYVCPVCNAAAYTNFNYCPNCGARMK